MECRKGKRPIRAECLQDYLRMDELLRSLPEDARKCDECCELVWLHPEIPDSPAPTGIASASVSGCERLIESAITRIIDEGLKKGFNFTECFERGIQETTWELLGNVEKTNNTG